MNRQAKFARSPIGLRTNGDIRPSLRSATRPRGLLNFLPPSADIS